MDENKEREIVNRAKDLFGDILDEYCEQLEKTGKVEITKSMKEKIIEISDLTKTSGVYQNNKDRMPWYLEKTKDETPESILNDCVSKVAISPTYLHSIVTVMLLMPIIAKKLQKAGGNMEKNLVNLTENIKDWAIDRGLQNADPRGQILKLYEELGELSAGMAKNRRGDIIDAIGDAYVVLTILSMQLDIDIRDCIAKAWNEIKDRKGRMINGIFVKESDFPKD